VAEIDVHGVRFHLQRLGDGPKTVVFLHGLVMDNLSSWFFTAAAPASMYARVLLYDLRGHGRSSRPASGYTLGQMVSDQLAILDAERVDRPIHLVGNSFGGLLALAFARAHPARVASLFLVDAHLGDQGFGEAMAKTLRLTGDARDRAIAASFSSWLGRHSERKRNRLAASAAALIDETSLVEDLRGTPPLVPSDLAAVSCSIVALYGEHSDLRESAERLLVGRPGCTVRILPGCTHSVLWEATGEVRRQIVEWVR
jgi:pimeloyl-ACP methyl ester carboxylesterase